MTTVYVYLALALLVAICTVWDLRRLQREDQTLIEWKRKAWK